MTYDKRDKLCFFASLLLVGLPSVFGILWLSNRIERLHCPPGSFLAETVEPGMQMLGIIIASLVLTFFAAKQVKAHVKWFQSPDHEWNGTLVPSYAYPIAFAVGAGLCILAAVSRFCAADSGVVYDDVTNSISKSFGWREVTAVSTRCYYQSGKHSGWHQNFFVTMTDGTSVDLMGKEDDMPSLYPRIVAALEGHDFAFSTNIDPKCEYSHMEMLTQRP